MDYYYIVSNANTSLGWSVQQQTICLGSRRSAFRMSATPGETQIIYRNKAVDVYMPATVNSAVPMRMCPSGQHRNQKFLIKQSGRDDGSVFMYPVSSVGPLVVDLFDPVSPRLTYWTENGGENQLWQLVRQIRGVQKNKTQIVPSTVASRARHVRSVYTPGFAFPEWSVGRFQAEYGRYAPKVVVYYPGGVAQSVVEAVATRREPVNIGMYRHYDLDAFETLFGWRHGYYGDHFLQTKKLAPNIGIYCLTPVRQSTGDFTDVHVMNAIGYAFDSTEQPDYQYFIVGGRQHELYEAYRQVFRKIYHCARQHGLSTVVMSLVGANNFAALYEDADGRGVGHFQRTIWVPALVSILEEKAVKSIVTYFMGAGQSVALRGLPGMSDIGHFPGCVRTYEASTTLFVNAWDPWSIVGNGNSSDNSLDGYMGRVSMMALLCWPMTNSHMVYTAI
jgi:hypothetical protein